MLKRSKRIHGRILVQSILKKGESKAGPLFVDLRLKRSTSPTRYAVLVGKKLAKQANERNHKRRQIYEAIQRIEKEGHIRDPLSFDIVLLVRRPAMKASFKEIVSSLLTHLSS